ncbi:MAG: DUF255 domain-containing protein [Bacteroidetes bacterium]|jgi:thioredoxin-related protein|nr:DUF255 domain-containing protein [Bacteroidota bacterium]
MKPFFLLLLPLLALSAYAPAPQGTAITWLDLETAQAQMKETPKKLFVDLYTDWCGWCKVMDKNSFAHPVIIEIMNKHFYAVKFNAEKGPEVNFKGTQYKLLPRGGKPLHEWAQAYGSTSRGLSYPTTIYFDENLNEIDVIPGYLDPHIMEKILTYVGEGQYAKGVSWEQFDATFKGRIPPSKE